MLLCAHHWQDRAINHPQILPPSNRQAFQNMLPQTVQVWIKFKTPYTSSIFLVCQKENLYIFQQKSCPIFGVKEPQNKLRSTQPFPKPNPFPYPADTEQWFKFPRQCLFPPDKCKIKFTINKLNLWPGNNIWNLIILYFWISSVYYKFCFSRTGLS